MPSVPEYLEEACRYVESWLSYQQELNELPGLSMAISYKGEVLSHRSFGHANIKTKDSLTPQHIFCLGSHTKTVTAMAIMKLVGAGKARLDDKALAYIPDIHPCDNNLKEVTIRQLLSHMSGISRDGDEAIFWSEGGAFPARKELITFLNQTTLALEQGTCFKYSNVGYALLGLLIEALSGQTYDAYIRDTILSPLNLRNTFIGKLPPKKRFATGHTRRMPQKGFIPFSYTRDAAALMPAAGLCGTLDDLCRLYSAFMDGKIVSPENYKIMCHRTKNKSGEENDYGCGLVVEEIDERTFYGHNGGFLGYISKTRFEPEQRIIVSLCVNALDWKVEEWVKSILSILRFFEKHSTSASGRFKAYEGRFENLWSVIDVLALGEKLYITRPLADNPLAQVAEITLTAKNTFNITKDSPFGSKGQEAVFNSGPMQCVKLGGISYKLQGLS